MSGLHLLHIAAVTAWLGTVFAEVAIEFAPQKNLSGRFVVARLHKIIDTHVELPLIAIVLISGVLLLLSVQHDTALWIKVGCGLVAIATNLVSAWYVFRRAKLVERDENLGALNTLTRKGIHYVALVGVPFASAALYLGVVRLIAA